MTTGLVRLDALREYSSPFPHFVCQEAIGNTMVKSVVDWFRRTNLWELVETDFYSQYEFIVSRENLPSELVVLAEENMIDTLFRMIKEQFGAIVYTSVAITAHKLIHGQSIAVHNDFISDGETHRVIFHFGTVTSESAGGILMLFDSPNSKDVAKLISPLTGSAFGFEISTHSHHAVSRVYNESRYSLVYSFTSLKAE